MPSSRSEIPVQQTFIKDCCNVVESWITGSNVGTLASSEQGYDGGMEHL